VSTQQTFGDSEGCFSSATFRFFERNFQMEMVIDAQIGWNLTNLMRLSES